MNLTKYCTDYLNIRKKKRQAKSFFRNFIADDDLCFDIGANVGDKTDLFLHLGARVVAVEPQPVCVKTLQKRFGKNPRFSVVSSALGSIPSQTDMYICDDIPVLSTLSGKWTESSRFASNDRVKWNRKIKVSLRTLDSLIEEYGVPKFCKIDVEGFELEVVKGLSQKIEYISFEFMNEFLNDAETVCSHLEKIGSIEVNYSLREELDWTIFNNRSWESKNNVLNKLLSFEDEKLWGDIYIKMI